MNRGALDIAGRLRFDIRTAASKLPLLGPGEQEGTDLADFVLARITNGEELNWTSRTWRKVAGRLRTYLNTIVIQSVCAGVEDMARVAREMERAGD